jgi:hypothetical protein
LPDRMEWNHNNKIHINYNHNNTLMKFLYSSSTTSSSEGKSPTNGYGGGYPTSGRTSGNLALHLLANLSYKFQLNE